MAIISLRVASHDRGSRRGTVRSGTLAMQYVHSAEQKGECTSVKRSKDGHSEMEAGRIMARFMIPPYVQSSDDAHREVLYLASVSTRPGVRCAPEHALKGISWYAFRRSAL